MFLALALTFASLVSNTNGYIGEDMTDEDFMAFVKVHDDMRLIAQGYGVSAGGGCVKGATQAAVTAKGFKALCIGCAVGAVSEVARDITFPREERMIFNPQENRQPWEKKEGQWTLNLNGGRE